MSESAFHAMRKNFLGNAPDWYKKTIIAFLILNPILLFTVGPFITGWALIVEFIFTLAMALKCYPLPAGGLLAIEAIAFGMASPETVYHEVAQNLPVLLLLMFMVAGIYFMQDMLRFVFTKVLVGIRSKILLSLLFSFMGAFLSAFLDALTVTAVVITVAYGFYAVYHKFMSEAKDDNDELYKKDLEEFRGFLRNLMMHAAVGTALGGACTLVGEPQNLLIGAVMGWDFPTFFMEVHHVALPVATAGFVTCVLAETFHIMGYGFKLPENVRKILVENAKEKQANMTKGDYTNLFLQVCVAIFLILGLAFHIAEVGLIGLAVIIMLTAVKGVTEEHEIGHSFMEGLPFTALLVVFFSIVGVIHDQHLFQPVIEWVLSMGGREQLGAYYIANGLLSAISDNVFVATVYINETAAAFKAGLIDQLQFDKLAVAINMGTNIPSVATPNGQAAFLFLLTSALAPVIRLSYMEMVKLALPYTIIMSITGYLMVIYWL
jgi:NhaB family Na+:H+ antiporter